MRRGRHDGGEVDAVNHFVERRWWWCGVGGRAGRWMGEVAKAGEDDERACEGGGFDVDPRGGSAGYGRTRERRRTQTR